MDLEVQALQTPPRHMRGRQDHGGELPAGSSLGHQRLEYPIAYSRGEHRQLGSSVVATADSSSLPRDSSGLFTSHFCTERNESMLTSDILIGYRHHLRNEVPLVQKEWR